MLRMSSSSFGSSHESFISLPRIYSQTHLETKTVFKNINKSNRKYFIFKGALCSFVEEILIRIQRSSLSDCFYA